MQIKNFIKLFVFGIFFLLVFYFFFYNKDKIIVNDNDLAQIKHLDIIVSKGQSFQSKLLNLSNLNSKNYTHTGLVCEDKGKIYILHATPDGTKDNAIRFDDLQTFIDLSNVCQYEILRFKQPDINTDTINKIIEVYKNHKYPFDYDFDNQTNNKLYCSELVYNIFNESGIYTFDFNLNKPIYPAEFTKSETLKTVVLRKSSENEKYTLKNNKKTELGTSQKANYKNLK